MTALLGTFVKLATLADGSVRLTLDMQCSLSDVAAMNLVPGVAFGIARITGESTITPVTQPIAPVVAPTQEPKKKAGELCIVACNFCKDPLFWKWLKEEWEYVAESELDAKHFLLDTLEIASRIEIDNSEVSRNNFMRYIRSPFMAWKELE